MTDRLTHVVATGNQLYQSATTIASLPAVLFGELEQALGSRVLRTVLVLVPRALANCAGSRITLGAGGDVVLDELFGDKG